ncbi:MAG: M20 family metallopeptidase [Chloroflexota bacterium]|nr:M20 family metallopeptidase [Dehalococcoidia bacterium]MDW8253274.1 M20 family metallopeptidase [Chloroflexota bacterium]
MRDERRLVLRQTIESAAADLRALSLAIHDHPELNFEERFAHALLTDFLHDAGFHVERGAYGLPTAFRASVGEGSPCVAVLCEYDALPEIGHACGHNLIAAAGVAAGLALKAAAPAGTVVVLGTPAEEGGGGKVVMLERGAFDGVDVAMMVHPAPGHSAWPNVIGVEALEAQFFGRSAHAAMAPHEGVNALDAMVLAFNAVALLRQQLPPDTRVHGVITRGGTKPNIIPDHTAAELYVRARHPHELDRLKERVVACFDGAARATGCRLEVRWPGPRFRDLRTNDPLAARYVSHLEALGVTVPPRGDNPLDRMLLSTDMGNVSYAVPAIHPLFRIETEGGNHTPAFAEAARSMEAHRAMLLAATAMAETAFDCFVDPALLNQARAAFALPLSTTGEE